MKKNLKKLFIGLAILIVVLFSINKILINNKETLLSSYPKNLVEVDGNYMNVHVEGTGLKTLVFLSGAGTPSPVLDFKPLYDKLSDEYRIVVIEKFGYGFSDTISNDRTFNTVLSQSRAALSKVGIEGPVILVPHSMSGLEAILWAQLYPNEVEAIIGLDMSVPRAYDETNFKGISLFQMVAGILRELGAARLYYTLDNLPKTLTGEEKEIYITLASKNSFNQTVVNETKSIQEAVRTIDGLDKPQVPILLFSSDGKETGVSNWNTLQQEYLSDLKKSKIVGLETGHYIHYEEYEKISREIRAFILDLEN